MQAFVLIAWWLYQVRGEPLLALAGTPPIAVVHLDVRDRALRKPALDERAERLLLHASGGAAVEHAADRRGMDFFDHARRFIEGVDERGLLRRQRLDAVDDAEPRRDVASLGAAEHLERLAPDVATLLEAWEHYLYGRFPETEELLRGLLTRNPHHPDALYLLGLVVFQRGEYKLALFLYRVPVEGLGLEPVVTSADGATTQAADVKLLGRTAADERGGSRANANRNARASTPACVGLNDTPNSGSP